MPTPHTASLPPLRCLFVVQGEGRGHMTQALALRHALAETGHEVVHVLLGRSKHRRVPAFFRDRIDAPLDFFDSPGFAFDGNRSLRLGATIAENVGRFQRFRAGLRRMHDAVQRTRPDVIVNFFDPLAGLYNCLYRPAAPLVCIGHQYLFLHPDYAFPPQQRLERRSTLGFTRFTSMGAARRLALSLYPAPDVPGRRIRVMPPLLRPEVFRQPLDHDDGFVLAYVLNNGYGDALRRWHADHPDVRLHCFWDHRAVPNPHRPHPNLTFHQLDGARFLAMMARCRAVVSTAGFESVSEARYFGKPILTVPVGGHYEQRCNAADAEHAGAGIAADTFDLSRLLDFARAYQPPDAAFRAWVRDAPAAFVREIERVAGRTPSPARAAADLVAA